jgi:hypothetical protein
MTSRRLSLAWNGSGEMKKLFFNMGASRMASNGEHVTKFELIQLENSLNKDSPNKDGPNNGLQLKLKGGSGSFEEAIAFVKADGTVVIDFRRDGEYSLAWKTELVRFINGRKVPPELVGTILALKDVSSYDG